MSEKTEDIANTGAHTIAHIHFQICLFFANKTQKALRNMYNHQGNYMECFAMVRHSSIYPTSKYQGKEKRLQTKHLLKM